MPDYDVESSIIIYIIHNVTSRKKNNSTLKEVWCGVAVAHDKTCIWTLALAEERIVLCSCNDLVVVVHQMNSII